MDYAKLNKSKFAAAVWEKGLDYCLENRVVKCAKEGKYITATVEGTEPYRVSICLNPTTGKASSMSCDCPYSESGHNCKHEAALIAFLSSNSIPEEKPAEPLKRSNDPAKDFCLALSSLTSYDGDRYVDSVLKLLDFYGPNLSPYEKRYVQKEAIAESHFHGGFNVPDRLGDLAYKFIAEEKDPRERPFYCADIYTVLPSFESKARFLHNAFADPALAESIEKLGTDHQSFSGKEFDELFLRYSAEGNFFLHFSAKALETIARYAVFNVVAKEEFLRASMAKQATDAIKTTLNRSSANLHSSFCIELQNYFSKQGSHKEYQEFMNQQIQHRSLPFPAVVEFYKSLTPAEQLSEAIYLRKAYYYTNYENDVAFLTDRSQFDAYHFSSLHFETIVACKNKILEAGPKAYLKPLEKRLAKYIRDISKNGTLEEEYIYFLEIVKAFQKDHTVLALLHNEYILKESYNTPSIRKAYLSTYLSISSLPALRRY